MQTTINWTNPINWLITSLLLALLLGQFWLIFRNQSLSGNRKWVRTGLNLLLWLVLVCYFLRIEWPIARPATHALLVADNVPSAFVGRIKDSLAIQESFTSRNFKPEYDSVTIVGQAFPTATLAQLSNATVRWIPFNQPDQLEVIHWKGVVRQGEPQHITGRIRTSTDQKLRIRYGNQTLDSVALHEGNDSFALQFPAFAQGRNQVELMLGNTPLDTLHFFTRPTQPLTVQFLLNSPDFESKILADWLGKHGHTVQLSATLSKDISSNVSINTAGKQSGKPTPDLIITEPANATSPVVRKAIAGGKGVFFINLTEPETDIRRINQAVGTRWQVRRTTNDVTVPVGNGLTALPYRFAENLNQFAVPGFPIAVQQTNGRVGISLLSETYPLALSGDSLTYNRIWMAALARLSQTDRNVVQAEAPIYSRIQQSISINNPTGRLQAIRVGQDTIPVTYSPINDRLATATSLFGESGWQPVHDTLALYIEPSDAPLEASAVVQQFIKAHSKTQLISGQTDNKTTAALPEWLWLVLLISCFTALWLEPKF